MLRRIGVDLACVEGGASYYTVESHLRHLREARLGDDLTVEARVLSHDVKRLHLFHRLWWNSDGTVLATGEHMCLHVDRTTGRAAPAPREVLDWIAALVHSQPPEPEGIEPGRAIRAAGAT